MELALICAQQVIVLFLLIGAGAAAIVYCLGVTEHSTGTEGVMSTFDEVTHTKTVVLKGIV